MLLRLPTSVAEARECLAEGAVPIGGATLLWATWQRDGFPETAMSLRQVPEANVLERDAVGGAVILARMDDRVPDVLRLAAVGVGTGAVRRSATVGGNVVGSTLRCLLPAALVLDARATVLESDGVRETDLSELVAKRPLLLSLSWRPPLASTFRKLDGAPGGRPPLVVASAVHTGDDGPAGVRVAVRDGYEVVGAEATASDDPGQTLDELRATALDDLPAPAWDVIRSQVTALTAGPRP
ncbi:FAD binding domain-containing protein [Streptomyces sp. NPDC056628]|uniref:FAD binding domain-containing protein n=1 Tax=Streptomyces sp. NPDC056628 TaxID=3345882 RepID=UPI0036B4DD3C